VGGNVLVAFFMKGLSLFSFTSYPPVLLSESVSMKTIGRTGGKTVAFNPGDVMFNSFIPRLRFPSSLFKDHTLIK
jgi:hypothetical protein